MLRLLLLHNPRIPLLRASPCFSISDLLPADPPCPPFLTSVRLCFARTHVPDIWMCECRSASTIVIQAVEAMPRTSQLISCIWDHVSVSPLWRIIRFQSGVWCVVSGTLGVVGLLLLCWSRHARMCAAECTALYMIIHVFSFVCLVRRLCRVNENCGKTFYCLQTILSI